MVMAVLLSGDYNRRGQSRRIITCIIIAIAIIALNMTLKNLAASGKNFFLIMMYFPSFVTILTSLYVLVIGKNPFTKPINAQLALENN
jgi:lipopolysaccharide export LptBFGC system permease protein LptF